ncbi:cobalamin biosynthesis protein CobQ [Maritimibacter sp. 55A14]|uniref:cobalamin biosynthesis protein CobQ n=1 Tax=Maritimibacter sp. 55A14 TaxID=2174844 RepID=UPI000D6094D1|nr:cobalamin biosynthesis protein CobQ [Maritimibacter sp. 55A14]PWE32064.1 cobalamin biosynthesis protein CobQ [Maritimibacter sp. 55A14]
MNTPAHLILGATLFARPDALRVTTAALAGALVPDLSLYLLSVHALYVQGLPPHLVFGEMYFSDAWQAVFAVDNSIILWAALAGLGLWLARAPLLAFGGAGLVHVLTDLPLHHDDGRPHFWPLTDWVYRSPISYWDGTRHADIVGPLEGVLALGLCLLLWQRFRRWPARAGIAVLAVLEMLPTLFWGFIFS